MDTEPKSTKRCGLPCEVWSRIVGYYRPVKYWNRGKKEEFRLRKTYRLSITDGDNGGDLCPAEERKAGNAVAAEKEAGNNEASHAH